MADLPDELAQVLTILRAAPGTLSTDDVAAQADLDRWEADEVLTQLQLRRLVQNVEYPTRARDRPRNKVDLWQATRPDLS